MATKVEELRDKVLGNYPKIATDQKGLARIENIIESVDSLIVAAKQEATENERGRVFLARVKETTFMGSEGMICLAYVIPAYVFGLSRGEVV